MMRLLKATRYLAALVWLSCLHVAAWACTCWGPEPPCAAYGRADVVFSGTVIASSLIEVEAELGKDEPKYKYQQRLVRLRVEQPHSGVPEAMVEVVTGLGGGDCGYGFKMHQQYLVYAQRQPNKSQLSTSICTRTKPLSQAEEDLAYIAGVAQAPASALLYGQIGKSVMGGDGSKQPLAGIRLAIKGEDKEITVVSDAAGNYRAAGLPVGKYKIEILPPAGLGAQVNEVEVTVQPRGCAIADFALYADRRISGRVVNAAGQPLAKAYLQLGGKEKNNLAGHVNSVYSDEDGKFAFRLVPPGRYTVIFNHDGPDGEFRPLPTFFYPGVQELAQAGEITVGENEQVSSVEFRLPPLTERDIAGTIFTSDDNPAPKAELICSMQGGRIRAPIKVDERGRFSFKGYEGLKLTLFARLGEDNDKQLQGAAEIAETGDHKGIKLMLSPRK